MAYLVFANTRADNQKNKRAFFANAPTNRENKEHKLRILKKVIFRTENIE